MSQIKNIVFDFGGVLVDWNSRYYYRGYFNDDSRMEYFLANICTDEWNLENDRGRSYAEGVAQLTALHPEFREAIEMFPVHWGEMLRGEKPESVALLRSLKDEGYRLYGLTNWSAENIHVAFERFDFLSLLEGTVVSGIEKDGVGHREGSETRASDIPHTARPLLAEAGADSLHRRQGGECGDGAQAGNARNSVHRSGGRAPEARQHHRRCASVRSLFPYFTILM